MRIVIVSDTHERHREFDGLEGDVLIHCGDMFELVQTPDCDIAEMDDWFGEQAFDLILCTGGNHDLQLEASLRETPQPFHNATYLQDAGLEYRGVSFWGAPWTPMLSGHAFYADRMTLEDKWWLIPDSTDVLITHTPPWAIMDASSTGRSYGCDALAAVVAELKPKVHCFGHVHNSRGMARIDGTLFVNASSVKSGAPGVLPPMVVDL